MISVRGDGWLMWVDEQRYVDNDELHMLTFGIGAGQFEEWGFEPQIGLIFEYEGRLVQIADYDEGWMCYELVAVDA